MKGPFWFGAESSRFYSDYRMLRLCRSFCRQGEKLVKRKFLLYLGEYEDGSYALEVMRAEIVADSDE